MAKETNRMKLSSPSFKDGESINEFNTCDRNEYAPRLSISNVPDNAKSLVLLMNDLDSDQNVPTNHWIVWNILPNTKIIEENSLPENAIEGRNDFDFNGYSGPCPHVGTHRYEFKLYALDKKLDLDEKSYKNQILNEIENSIIAESTLIGTYQRIDITEDEMLGLREKPDEFLGDFEK